MMDFKPRFSIKHPISTTSALWHEQGVDIWLLGFWLHMLQASRVWQGVMKEERWRGQNMGRQLLKTMGNTKFLSKEMDGQFLSVF